MKITLITIALTFIVSVSMAQSIQFSKSMEPEIKFTGDFKQVGTPDTTYSISFGKPVMSIEYYLKSKTEKYNLTKSLVFDGKEWNFLNVKVEKFKEYPTMTQGFNFQNGVITHPNY